MNGLSNRELQELASDEQEKQPEGGGSDSDGGKKYIVSLVGEKKYAVAAEAVKEIIMNQDLYPLPFVPEWLCGLLNYHGDPCAVVDIGRLLGSGKIQGASKVLVFKSEFGGIAFKVADVDKIYKLADNALYAYPDKEGAAVFFTAMLQTPEGDIPLLGVDRIVEEVRNIKDRTGSAK